MSFRGRGRGGFQRRPTGGEKPFELFPSVELPDRNAVTVENALILSKWTQKLGNFWKSSSYYIEAAAQQKKRKRPEVETYSYLTKPRSKTKSDDLWEFMKPTHLSFPSELINDGKGLTRPQKKARWNPDADMKKLDFFEKLEKQYQEQQEKNQKKKKDDESDEEPEEEAAEEDEEFSDDGDYNQNVDFDDDEDDYNMEDDHDDEPTY